MIRPPVLWTPTKGFIENSNLNKYQNWLFKTKGLKFKSYDDLWDWSIKKSADFWVSITEYFNVSFHNPYKSVVTGTMPNCSWFEGSTLNYVEHIFKNKTINHPAIIYKSENSKMLEISWDELEQKVKDVQQFLISKNIKKGDAVAAYMPAIPEATIAFLATISLGAIWSSCSPDFGISSVVDRLGQIKPKVLFVAEEYSYNGKLFNKLETIKELKKQLPTVNQVVLVGKDSSFTNWNSIPKSENELKFEAVPFSHPIWVLYSSGTTGIPKAITHSHGGCLLEHLKYLTFHNNCKPGDRLFWYTTTGWMMWNYVNATLLTGATMVLYQGSPAYPNLNTLWEFAQNAKITHFGTSAGFITACMKSDISPIKTFDLSSLESISSTGSPLSNDNFDWVYNSVKKDVWLISMSGGTDVCTAFVGGCPTKPVYEGEIQSIALGCNLQSFNENGDALINEVGEMVITHPMPSMPIYFWNDENNESYQNAYFDDYPNVWRHGDWLKITERNTVIIYGRSDTTLNRNGIRIGTSEIYRSVEKIPEVLDSIIVCILKPNDQYYMPLYVVLKTGIKLTTELKYRINSQIKLDYSARHIPDEIIAINEVPYTLSGKKMETAVNRILLGKETASFIKKDVMKNPDSLDFFMNLKV